MKTKDRHESYDRKSHLLQEKFLALIEKQTESTYLRALAETCSPGEAGRDAERYLEVNGVCGIQGDGSFEATVDTDEGPKYLSGVSVNDAVNEATAFCQSLNNQISRAFDALPPEDALRSIGAVWRLAENTCELAAARSRLVLGKLPRPCLSQTPDWYRNRLEELDEEDGAAVSPASLAASETIVRAVACKFPSLHAEVSVGLLGRVVLDWHALSSRYAWMIDATELPFPAVNIYEASSHAVCGIETRIIHDMHEALCAIGEMANRQNVV